MSKVRPPFKFDKENLALTSATTVAPDAKRTSHKDGGEVSEISRGTGRAPSRKGKKGVTFYLSPEAWRQLKILAVQRDRPIQDLMLDAVDLLFIEHGQHRLAKE